MSIEDLSFHSHLATCPLVVKQVSIDEGTSVIWLISEQKDQSPSPLLYQCFHDWLAFGLNLQVLIPNVYWLLDTFFGRTTCYIFLFVKKYCWQHTPKEFITLVTDWDKMKCLIKVVYLGIFAEGKNLTSYLRIVIYALLKSWNKHGTTRWRTLSLGH